MTAWAAVGKMVQNVFMLTRSLFEVKTSGVQIHGIIVMTILSMIL